MKQLLTGKCLEDFEKWFEENTNKELAFSITDDFFTYPLSKKFGVIQDFADSKGIHITLYQMDYQAWYGYRITSIVFLGDAEITLGVWRREKARGEAIKHFNKIYNEAK